MQVFCALGATVVDLLQSVKTCAACVFFLGADRWSYITRQNHVIDTELKTEAVSIQGLNPPQDSVHQGANHGAS